MGVSASLTVLSGILEPYNENRHATLIIALNYSLETPTNEPLKTSISSETKQLIDALLRKEDVVPGLDEESDSVVSGISSGLDLKGAVIMKIWIGRDTRKIIRSSGGSTLSDTALMPFQESHEGQDKEGHHQVDAV